jgi:hypothetical protein
MILYTIKDITENSLSRGTTFKFANIFEANFDLDKLLTASDFPVHVLLPFEVRDRIGSGGSVRSTAALEGFFLTRSEMPTIDYETMEVESSMVAPMRSLAREFFHKLSESEITSTEVNDLPDIRYIPTYHSMDAHLFGVHYIVSWPVMENISGCVLPQSSSGS